MAILVGRPQGLPTASLPPRLCRPSRGAGVPRLLPLSGQGCFPSLSIPRLSSSSPPILLSRSWSLLVEPTRRGATVCASAGAAPFPPPEESDKAKIAQVWFSVLLPVLLGHSSHILQHCRKSRGCIFLPWLGFISSTCFLISIGGISVLPDAIASFPSLVASCTPPSIDWGPILRRRPVDLESFHFLLPMKYPLLIQLIRTAMCGLKMPHSLLPNPSRLRSSSLAALAWNNVNSSSLFLVKSSFMYATPRCALS